MSKVDTKTISENLDVAVTHESVGYTVACINKNTTGSLAVRVNFENSTNSKPVPAAGCKAIGANIIEAMIPAGATMVVAKLEPVDANEKMSYKYTCATQLRKAPAAAGPAASAPAPAAAPAGKLTASKAVVTATPATNAAPVKPAANVSASPSGNAPVPEGTEETETKVLTEGLEILIHSINNGYNLQIRNKDAGAQFTVVLDLAESQNLVIAAQGSAKAEGKNVTVVVPPSSTVNCVDMPVDNWDLGSCELRYKAGIRKS